MRVTDITAQRRSEQRVNIFLDGAYWVSLDIVQVIDFGISIGREISESQKAKIETESVFGKAYAAALNLISIRFRSEKEIRDYAWRKKWEPEIAERVIERLVAKGYLNDQRFAERWVEGRASTKPMSKRRVAMELAKKGVARDQADQALSTFDDERSLRAVISKKRSRYGDRQKFIQYLMRQGFAYGDITTALQETEEE